ncbi:MAG: hypothetical protein EBQ57_00505 [Actinobacteria bacterium]|nr:hypothetical protein [Actinomycetota bacterium]
MNTPITKVDWPTWPQFGEEEATAVADVVRSQQLFAATQVKKFEQDFAQFLGSKRAVGIGNATQGLHLALASLDIGEGDEVITTPCSWISSSSCILMQNAVPVFIDIESESLGMDPALIERAITPLTKAILPVHILGYPARIPEICEVAKAHGIPVVEDASHAPGASVNGKMVGTFGVMGVFSLQQRKTISTGDGAELCTDDECLPTNLAPTIIRRQRTQLQLSNDRVCGRPRSDWSTETRATQRRTGVGGSLSHQSFRWSPEDSNSSPPQARGGCVLRRCN